MKTIKLSQGKVAIVDDKDYEVLSKYKWYATCLKYCKNQYAARNVFKNGKKTIIRMHRIILNVPDNMQIDHINGNGLDNRRCNLRFCNHAQNQANSKTKNRYKGVRCRKGTGSWEAYIGENYKYIHLGTYGNKEDAAQAYNNAAIKTFGEFARLNKVLRYWETNA